MTENMIEHLTNPRDRWIHADYYKTKNGAGHDILERQNRTGEKKETRQDRTKEDIYEYR